MTASPSPQRNTALDFAKGALVLFMVLYHWGNYFLGPTPYFYDLLRFLTPSFIFITGAIAGLIYIGRYGLDDWRAQYRLALRGLKLAALFTVLNLGIEFLLPDKSRGATFGLPSFSHDLFAIYVTGNSNSASFKVLLPIAYLLLLSVGFLQVLRWKQGAVLACAILVCLALQAAEWRGWMSSNLFLLSFGFLGLALHSVGFTRINAAAGRLGLVAGLYVGYLALMLWLGPLYWVQLAGVSLTLLLFYGVGLRWTEGLLARLIVLLGRYSLFAYVGQIGILKALYFASRRLDLSREAALAVIPLAALLMVGLVWAVEFARPRFRPVDLIYRFTFA